MRFRDGALFVVLGIAVGAGAIFAYGLAFPGPLAGQLDAALVELGDSRLALAAARDRSDKLERGLYEARTIAIDSAKSVGDALVAANSITDRGQRIVKLVDTIRAVIKDLKRVSEAGSLIP
jgi:hypothetical protein